MYLLTKIPLLTFGVCSCTSSGIHKMKTFISNQMCSYYLHQNRSTQTNASKNLKKNLHLQSSANWSIKSMSEMSNAVTNEKMKLKNISKNRDFFFNHYSP